MRMGSARKLLWAKRVGWLLLIWALSVAVMAMLALVIRIVLRLFGLTL